MALKLFPLEVWVFQPPEAGRKGCAICFPVFNFISKGWNAIKNVSMWRQVHSCEHPCVRLHITGTTRISLHLLPIKRKAGHGDRGSLSASLLYSSPYQRTDQWRSVKQHQAELYELWALSSELQLHHCCAMRVKKMGHASLFGMLPFN